METRGRPAEHCTRVVVHSAPVVPTNTEARSPGLHQTEPAPEYVTKKQSASSWEVENVKLKKCKLFPSSIVCLELKNIRVYQSAPNRAGTRVRHQKTICQQ